MKRKIRNEKTFVAICFCVSVLIRFFLGNFYPRTINCYPDELLYLSLGDSFWNNHSIQVFNVPSSFFRIGYPLLISPAFALTSLRARGTVIALINAILVSLGIFPAHAIARRILKEKKYIMLCVGLYVISPSLTYSMTYMSENLYLPVALLFVYLCYRFFEEAEKKKKVSLAIGILLFSGFAYLIKSVALAFPVAFVCACLIEMIRSKDKKKRIFAVAIFVLGIIAAVVVLKLGLIQWDATVLQTKAGYILFGFLFFVLITILAFCVIPVFLPGMYYRQLDDNVRKFYGFMVFLILATALVVSAMIYTTEDYPSLTPRAHVRYVEFLFIPFVVLTCHILEQHKEKLPTWKIAVVFGVWAVAQLVVFRGFSGQTVDHTMLFYWQLIADEGKYFPVVRVRILSAIIIAVAVTLIWVYNRNRLAFQRIFVVGLVLMSLGNGVMSSYVQYKTHTHPKEETSETEQLRAFVREHNEDNFLVLEPDGFCELIDTYLIDCDNVRTGLEPIISQKKEEFQLPSQIVYIIVFDQSYSVKEGVELITTYPNLGYSLYRVTDKRGLEL